MKGAVVATSQMKIKWPSPCVYERMSGPILRVSRSYSQLLWLKCRRPLSSEDSTPLVDKQVLSKIEVSSHLCEWKVLRAGREIKERERKREKEWEQLEMWAGSCSGLYPSKRDSYSGAGKTTMVKCGGGKILKLNKRKETKVCIWKTPDKPICWSDSVAWITQINEIVMCLQQKSLARKACLLTSLPALLGTSALQAGLYSHYEQTFWKSNPGTTNGLPLKMAT